jgi:hypothetical protein
VGHRRADQFPSVVLKPVVSRVLPAKLGVHLAAVERVIEVRQSCPFAGHAHQDVLPWLSSCGAGWAYLVRHPGKRSWALGKTLDRIWPSPPRWRPGPFCCRQLASSGHNSSSIELGSAARALSRTLDGAADGGSGGWCWTRRSGVNKTGVELIVLSLPTDQNRNARTMPRGALLDRRWGWLLR